MTQVSDRFGKAVAKKLREKGWSYRRATIATRIDHNTIGTMRAGIVPSRGKVIQWAEALGEELNYWLKLAGYEPIAPDLIEGAGAKRTAKADKVKEEIFEYLVKRKGFSQEEIEEIRAELEKKGPDDASQ